MLRPRCLTSQTPVKPQGAAGKQAEQVEWMSKNIKIEIFRVIG